MVPLLQTGDVTVEQYVNVLLAQVEKHKTLNAFITIDVQQVRHAARQADTKRRSGRKLGPLFGIPFALKDIIVTSSLRTTFGTQVFANYKGSRNAPLVDRLLAADAILFGKNNAQEWAFGSNGYNAHYGQQLNPYNQKHIAGGSSGGGAASVSAGMVPIAIGSDTAASIRVPAAFTGLYGFRPSTGRYDNSGVAPIAPTLDTVGPLARSVDDLALIDAVLSEDVAPLPELGLQTIRLGVPRGYFSTGVSAEMKQAFNGLLEVLAQHDVTLVEVELTDASLADEALYPILFGETRQAVTDFLSQWGGGVAFSELHAGLGLDVKAMWDQLVLADAPGAIPDAVYAKAVDELRPRLQASYAAYLLAHDLDAIIFPATAHSAPLAAPADPQETVIDGVSTSIFINDHNSSPGALAGQPGVVMPLVLSRSGLPFAVSLDGGRGDDRRLLAVAKAIDGVLAPLPGPVVRH